MKTSLLVETHPHAQPGLPDAHLVRVLLRIEGEAPRDEHRVPLNLALVLDRSGSMGGGKLEAVKRAARDLVRRLHPDDRVSVVAFDDHVDTVAVPSTASERPDLLDRLMGIETGGSTNLSGGWLQGRALTHLNHDPRGVNRVVLLTDGLANVGITDGPQLRSLCAQALEGKISTTTVGVGAGYDENLLADMADAGGGGTYYIERLDQAGGVFDEELEGLLSIAAQNLTVSVRPRDAAELSVVHHSYPARAGDDDTLTLTIGDLYAREPREVLADFVVRGGAGPQMDLLSGDGPRPVVDLVVEADVWSADGAVERQRISLPVTFDPAEGAVSHPEVEKVYTLLKAAEARREAVEMGDRGDVDGAVSMLREASLMISCSDVAYDLAAPEMEELEGLASQMEAQGAMSPEDRKFLFTKQQMYSKSRRSAGERLRREQ